jgi:hypothetical protein
MVGSGSLGLDCREPQVASGNVQREPRAARPSGSAGNGCSKGGSTPRSATSAGVAAALVVACGDLATRMALIDRIAGSSVSVG